MEIDVSELQGRSFKCLEGCAMCCLCQPELTMNELESFRKHGLVAGLTREHIQGYTTKDPTAIKLQGGIGACHFLLNRKCTIYPQRPAFCRQFPVHVHALHRVQLNANLSCRGISEGGASLARFGNEVIKKLDPRIVDCMLSETRAAVKEFEAETIESNVFQPLERIRSVASDIIPVIGRRDGIGKIVAFADSGQDVGCMPSRDLLCLIREMEPPEDLEEAAAYGNYEQFELDNPAWQPIYVDTNLKWRTFRSADGSIEVSELMPEGKHVPEMEIPMSEMGLLFPDDGALGVFEDYARLLNSRDQFLGYVYHVSREEDFQTDLLTVYLGVLGTTMLDLWWRASLVGRILGRNRLDAELAMEGVRAFDMDCLDMPTIGGFF